MANKLNAAQEAVLEEELNVDPDSLLGKWRAKAYNQNADKQWLQKFWSNYFAIEKNIYELLLMNPDEEVKGTVKELADKYNISVETMVGFLDGINDSLKVKNPIETMTEDSISCSLSRESPTRSSSRRRSAEMIRARAAPARNTSTAAAEM